MQTTNTKYENSTPPFYVKKNFTYVKKSQLISTTLSTESSSAQLTEEFWNDASELRHAAQTEKNWLKKTVNALTVENFDLFCLAITSLKTQLECCVFFKRNKIKKNYFFGRSNLFLSEPRWRS